MKHFSLGIVALATMFAGCAATKASQPRHLATAEVAADFDSYVLRRVGLIVHAEMELTAEQERQLQAAFFAEFSASTPYEIVQLRESDLVEIPTSKPYRTGWYRTQTVIDTTRRYRLDGILVGTVTDLQFYSPQRIAVQFDLVAAETGIVIWASSAHLDSARKDVREAMHSWADDEMGGIARDDWRLVLISPRRFARFAARQVARVL